MYELSYLISGNIAENDLNKATSAVEDEIQKIGGQILNKIEPIKKNLSYPIKKQDIAYLTTIYFEVSDQNFQDLHKTLELNSNILRHLLIEVSQSAMDDYMGRQEPDYRDKRNKEGGHPEGTKDLMKNETKRDSSLAVQNDTEKQKEEVAQAEPVEEVVETPEEKTIEETPEKEPVKPKQEETADDNKEKVKIEDIDKKIDEILNKTNI